MKKTKYQKRKQEVKAEAFRKLKSFEYLLKDGTSYIMQVKTSWHGIYYLNSQGIFDDKIQEVREILNRKKRKCQRST